MKSESLRLLVSAVGLASFAWIFLGSGPDFMASLGMKQNHQTVAAGAIAQYEMAMRNGDSSSACFSAGVASSAFLSAQQEVDYRKWRTLYEQCEAARSTRSTLTIGGVEPPEVSRKAGPSY